MNACICETHASMPTAAEIAELQAEGLSAGLGVLAAARQALLILEGRGPFREQLRTYQWQVVPA